MKYSPLACLSVLFAASATAVDNSLQLRTGERSSSSTRPRKATAQRRLAFARICGYQPLSQVTDQAALDLDQQAFEQELFLGRLSQARNVYALGGYSGSYAKLTLINPPTANISAGSAVIGRAPSNNEVYGTLVDHAVWSTSKGHNKEIKVAYLTSDQQEKYVGCQVGGLYTFHEANLDGCFSDTGHITVMGEDKASSGYFNYTYNIRVDNNNTRTLQGLSTEANLTMRASENPCEVCPYLDDFSKFLAYYGDPNYADKWVMGASYNQSVEFSSGRGGAHFPLFQHKAALASAQAKASVLMSVGMAVIQHMEHAIIVCDKKNRDCADPNATTCGHDPTPLIDSAVAFYAGSLEGEDGTGKGRMYYEATHQMALNFATCGESGMDAVGEAWANGDVIREFQKAQGNLVHGGCNLARKSKELIVNTMKIPLVQGVLKYAHKLQYEPSSNAEVAEQEAAEGATFAAALLPYLHACSEPDAETVYQYMKVGSNSSDVKFVSVKAALERNYGCLGVTCENVGGVWTVNGYAKGASPCATAASSSSSPGAIAAATIGTVVSLVLVGFLYLRFRQRKLRRERQQRTSNIAAVSDIS